MRGADIAAVPQSMVSKVVKCLETQKEELVERSDYLGAQEFEDKINALKMFSTEATYDSLQDYRLTELKQKLEAAKEELQVSIARRDAVIKSFLEKREQALAELDMTMRRELAAFDDANSSSPPPKFRRFSPELLNMRRREKAMVAARRYVEANVVKGEADALERKETEQNTKNWKAFVLKQRSILLKRHQEQRRIMEEKWDKEWASVLPSGDEDVARCENAVKAIEARIADFNLDHLPLEGPITRGMTSRSVSAGRCTPRRWARVTQSSLSPIQDDRLRSRMTYVRTKNYNKIRMRQVRSQLTKKLNKC